MAERSQRANRWLFGAAYFGLMTGLILMRVSPIEIWPARLPGPELMACVTFAWVLRRPQYVPVLLVAAAFLLADMLFYRPPGLWTALMVLGVEFLRAREHGQREQPFPVEWALVAGTLLAMVVADRLVQLVFLVEPPALGLVLLQYLVTVMSYPLVVMVVRSGFGVAKMTPGETDAKGRPR